MTQPNLVIARWQLRYKMRAAVSGMLSGVA